MEFLEEYTQMMEPLAIVLDLLQDFKKTISNMFNANRNEATTDKPVVDNSEDEADSSFFSWSNDKHQGTSTISVENEVCQYLSRSPTKKLTSLNEYPNVKKSCY
uniref:Uncharacterized protein n=1 Tax=Sipha flava TaxID=143950 RepID=A0A2S2QJR5_9HEMI